MAADAGVFTQIVGRHHGSGPVETAEAVARTSTAPGKHCVLLLPRRRHQAGNLGVEHAAPDAVQRALATARLSQPERQEFDREDLVALGLFTPMGAAQAQVQVDTRYIEVAISFCKCRWILHMTCRMPCCEALCRASVQLGALDSSRGAECCELQLCSCI